MCRDERFTLLDLAGTLAVLPDRVSNTLDIVVSRRDHQDRLARRLSGSARPRGAVRLACFLRPQSPIDFPHGAHRFELLETFHRLMPKSLDSRLIFRVDCRWTWKVKHFKFRFAFQHSQRVAFETLLICAVSPLNTRRAPFVFARPINSAISLLATIPGLVDDENLDRNSARRLRIGKQSSDRHRLMKPTFCNSSTADAVGATATTLCASSSGPG